MSASNDQLKAHDFPEVYMGFGIDLSTLGCVMLDVDLGDFIEYPIGDLYFSKDPKRFWIDGAVGTKKAHLTLLYGLLHTAKNYQRQIEQVLNGWKLDTLEIESIGYFGSPYEDEKYFCLVAHIKITPELLEGHSRLEFLPHINTFPGYKAHVTLAYVKEDPRVRDWWIKHLTEKFVGRKIPVKAGINLGGNR